MNNSNLILNENHNSFHLHKKLKRNVSLKKVLELSNKLNLPYSKLINLYINKGINYSYSYIVNLIENEDVQKLKEIILNNGLIIYQRNVYIHSRSNELQGVFLDDKYYQKLLRILIENDEVSIANLITTNDSYFREINISIKNIDKYLYDDLTKQPSSFINKVYDSLDEDIKEIIEPKLVNAYIDLIKEIKTNNFDKLNNQVLIKVRYLDNSFIYELDNLYLKFKDYNTLLIKSLFNSIKKKE